MDTKYRVWWIPQVPTKPFYVDVSGPEEAKKILDILGEYDLFQYNNKIKPDYCNAGGFEEMEIIDGKEEWFEWEDDEGNQIDDWESEPQIIVNPDKIIQV